MVKASGGAKKLRNTMVMERGGEWQSDRREVRREWVVVILIR
jgi:hypothetical protein